VRVFVVELVEVEVGGGESDVGLGVHPDSERIPICDQDPLPDVELARLHYHRVLDVLLTNVLGLSLLGDIEDFDQVLVEYNATTSGRACRLDDPNVALTVDVVLREHL